ncbi:hypothetical protein AB2T85_06805 [Clostridium butyricum]|uniref:hypothetical protein n=1 Tax=Clostridium butyricum TaxID=1492 RepID=UPI0034668C13
MKKKLFKVISTLIIGCSLLSVPASANTWHPYTDSYGNTITWFMTDYNDMPVTGWWYENGEWYYLNDHGIALVGTKCYYDSSNNMWVDPFCATIDNEIYFFDSKACMLHDCYVWNGFKNLWIDSNGHIKS